MSKTSEIRKELWDYIKSIGVELTASQHDKIKEIVERYVAEKGGFMGGLFQEMQKSNEKMNAHHRYYHPKCDKKPPPAKAKPGETMTTVTSPKVVVGVDHGKPGADMTVEVTAKHHDDGRIEVVKVKTIKPTEAPKKKPHFHKRGQLRCELC